MTQLQMLWWSSIPSSNFIGCLKRKLDGLLPPPPPALSMNRGTNYPSTNRVKWICLSIFYIWSIVSNSRQSFMKIGWMIPVDAKFYDFIFLNLRGRGVFCQHHHILVWKLPQQTFTSSKSTIETIEECVKYQS